MTAPRICRAQQATQQGVSGFPVTGRMLCGDTQKAARFAQAFLIPAQGAATDTRNGFGNGFGGRRTSARTDLDGNFLIPNVSAGDYYVAGSLPGYVNAATLVQNVLSGAAEASTIAGVPLIHVAAGGASTVLTLQRGATIAGSVQWDDGSPAAGVNVSAQPAGSSSASGAAQLSQGARGFGSTSNFSGANGNGQTDDRGHYRISGLVPGTYYVRVTLQAPAPQRPEDGGFVRNLSLGIYAPNKLRRSDATPVPLGVGEERDDLNVVVGLSSLHNVLGTVNATGGSVHSGTATLTDQADGTFVRTVSLAADGSFAVPYVPTGNYTLRVVASSRFASPGRGGDTGDSAVRFQPAQISLTVTDGDLTGIAVNVTQANTSP